MQLLRLAHRYQMQHLLETAVARLSRTLRLEDGSDAVLETFKAALELDVKPLVDRVEALTRAPEAQEWWTALVSDGEKWSRLCQETTAGNALMRGFVCNALKPAGPQAAEAAAAKKRKLGGGD